MKEERPGNWRGRKREEKTGKKGERWLERTDQRRGTEWGKDWGGRDRGVRGSQEEQTRRLSAGEGRERRAGSEGRGGAAREQEEGREEEERSGAEQGRGGKTGERGVRSQGGEDARGNRPGQGESKGRRGEAWGERAGEGRLKQKERLEGGVFMHTLQTGFPHLSGKVRSLPALGRADSCPWSRADSWLWSGAASCGGVSRTTQCLPGCIHLFP